MMIDRLMSPAIGKTLVGLTVSDQVLGSLDMGEPRNHGALFTPQRPGFVVTIKGATSGGAATAVIKLKTDDNAAMTSAATIYTSPTFALADLAGDGSQFFIEMPDTDLYEQFLAATIVVGGAVFTAGTVSVEYAAGNRNWRAYPSEPNA